MLRYVRSHGEFPGLFCRVSDEREESLCGAFVAWRRPSEGQVRQSVYLGRAPRIFSLVLSTPFLVQVVGVTMSGCLNIFREAAVDFGCVWPRVLGFPPPVWRRFGILAFPPRGDFSPGVEK